MHHTIFSRTLHGRTLDFRSCIASPNRFITMEVTNTDFADNSFDAIPGDHIPPYVRGDPGALSVIFRCLQVNALAMIDSKHGQDKARSVDAYRRENPQFDDDYFAQNGDPWVYAEDSFERLEAVGFKVRINLIFDHCDDDSKRGHSLKDHHEMILACTSPRGDPRISPPHRRRQTIRNE